MILRVFTFSIQLISGIFCIGNLVVWTSTSLKADSICPRQSKYQYELHASSGANSPFSIELNSIMQDSVQEQTTGTACENIAPKTRALYQKNGYAYAGDVDCTLQYIRQENVCLISVSVQEFPISSLAENDGPLSSLLQERLQIKVGFPLDTIALENRLRLFYESAEFKHSYRSITVNPYILPDKTMLISFKTRPYARTFLEITTADAYKDGINSGFMIKNPEFHLGGGTILRDSLYGFHSQGHFAFARKSSGRHWLLYQINQITLYRNDKFTDLESGIQLNLLTFNTLGMKFQSGPLLTYNTRNVHQKPLQITGNGVIYGGFISFDERENLLEPRLGNYFLLQGGTFKKESWVPTVDFQWEIWNKVSGKTWFHVSGEGTANHPTQGKMVKGESISWPSLQLPEYIRISPGILYSYQSFLVGPSLEYISEKQWGALGVLFLYFGDSSTIRLYSGFRALRIFQEPAGDTEFIVRGSFFLQL